MKRLSSVVDRVRAMALVSGMLWMVSPAWCAPAAGADEASSATPSATVFLIQAPGMAPLRLQGRDVSSVALRQGIAGAQGASLVLVIRSAGLAGAGRPQLRLNSTEAALPVVTLLDWIDAGPAEQVFLVLDLSGASGLCQWGELRRLLPSKPQLALICRENAGPQDPRHASMDIARIAIKRLTEATGPESPSSVTALGLLAELTGQSDVASRPVTYRRGKDWPISITQTAATPPVAVPPVAAVDKLDSDLRTLSAPDLDAARLDALLASLEQSGVTVRRGSPPAVKVRITATSADAATELRPEIERVGGEIGVLFDNTLFALIPVAQMRHLAALDSVWTMAVNRPTMHPIQTP